MATPIDFSKYVLNQLKIDNLTQDLLLGSAYDLLKGTCTSSIELEYNFQECFNALTEKLDWNNPEGDRYPFDLSKPLPLQGRLGHLTVADCNILQQRIEDMVPPLWSTIKHAYDKDAAKGIKHCVSVKKLHGYGHLEEAVVKRVDRQLCKFKEESYQKNLNITPPQQTFPKIDFKELYTPPYKPPGVIYKELVKQIRVMRADELYKFSDGKLKKV
ncbi:hypothetical protein Tco_0554168 [Tanacetum coccineum]